MAGSRLSGAAVAVVAASLLGAALGAPQPSLEVHRLLQIDVGAGATPLGSRSVAFQQHATLPSGGRGVHRAVVVVPPTQKLSAEDLDALVEGQSGGTIGGLLFVLPRAFGEPADGPLAGTDTSEELARWGELEQVLVGTKIGVPVYFAVEDDALADVVKTLEARIAGGDLPTGATAGFKLKAHGKAPKKLARAKLSNLQATISGAAEGAGERKTVLVTAAYDTLAAAPALSSGTSSATATAGVLELLRAFARLYEEARTRGTHDLVFMLHAGARFDYSGASHWLTTADQRLLETVDFALCLDSLGAWGAEGTGLKLHVSRVPKDPETAAVYGAFEAAAAAAGAPLEVVQRKIDLASEAVRWPHEHFAKRRVLAMTLSDAADPQPGFTGVADRPYRVNTTALATAVRVAGDAIARHVYGDGTVLGVGGDVAGPKVNAPHLRSWFEHLAKVPRGTPFLGEKDSAVLGTLQKALLEQVKAKDIAVQPFTLSADATFYGGTGATLTIFTTASVLFDMWLLGANLLYLGALGVVVGVSFRGWSGLMEALALDEPRLKKRI